MLTAGGGWRVDLSGDSKYFVKTVKKVVEGELTRALAI